MACGHSFYEENPLRDKQREEASAKKDSAAAAKIEEFFTQQGLRVMRSVCARQEPKRIGVITYTEHFVVRHRGHELTVSTGDALMLERTFRAWCNTHMQHARVYPKQQGGTHARQPG